MAQLQKIGDTTIEVGRKLALTDEIEDEIIEGLENSCPMGVASEAAGINRNTFFKYLQKGAKHEEICPLELEDCFNHYSECKIRTEHGTCQFDCCLQHMGRFRRFAHRIKKARAKGHKSNTEGIKKAGQDPRNWPALAWLNERTNPEDFGKKAEIAVEHKQSLNAQLSLEQKKELMLLLQNEIESEESQSTKNEDPNTKLLVEKDGVFQLPDGGDEIG